LVPQERIQVGRTAWRIASSFLIMVILAGAVLYMGKYYYPPLPFDGSSKREVVKKLDTSNGEFVLLAEGVKMNWYGFKGNMHDAGQALQDLMRERNLAFIEQMGAAYLFEDAEGNRIIVESEQWTGRYRMFEVPN